MKFVNLHALGILILAVLPISANAETFLLMAEEDGCFWCEKWNSEIGTIYPKTVEGKTAPLRRYDLHDEQPNVDFQSTVHFTPTFVLVRDGAEVGRIEGYPGEDFFWGLLGKIFKDAKIQLENLG